MRLLHSKIAPAIFAIGYGSLMALGSALHLLPGLDQFSGWTGHFFCCHDHGGYHSDPKFDGSDPAHDTSAACPICDFLALGQDRPSVVAPLARDERVEPTICADHAAPCCEPIRLHSARGPPNASRFAIT